MPLYGKHGKNLMKTDVRETDNSYELDVDLPGFKKDEINVEIAERLPDHPAPPRVWTRTSRTRTASTSARSATPVPAAGASTSGEDVPAEDISAKYEDGILRLSVPKADQKELPKTSTIAIE